MTDLARNVTADTMKVKAASFIRADGVATGQLREDMK